MDLFIKMRDKFLRKVKLRDERWECIKDMVLLEPDIYEANKRGPLIKRRWTTRAKPNVCFINI